ncbi:MAG: GntR family transcriptional regulator [Candidatus Sulfotelmatobacter sp.]
MQLWLARESEVSVREQLVTQVVLGILSDDLAPGQRLPSTRELARRFKLHPNTISAGYRQLHRDRWVELRRGSGVYVAARKPEAQPPSAVALDEMIAALVRKARGSGISLPALRWRLRRWLELQPPDHFLLVEPDEELRRILVAEVQQAVSFPIRSCGMEDCRKACEGGVPIALPNRAPAIRKVLPEGTELITLQVRSVPTSLGSWLPAPTGALVGIASRWPEFLKVARAVLNAAGFHPDSLIFRDARSPNWHRGLAETTAVVCDSVTATKLPAGCRAIPFTLLSQSSTDELLRFVKFVNDPIVDPHIDSV